MSRFCVVIPTYNERDSIASIVAGAKASGASEVIVVNDGHDGTAAIAREAGARVIDHWPHRRGLAASIVEGLYIAYMEGYGYAVVMDAGGTHDPNLIDPLVRKCRMGYDVVIASRFYRDPDPPWYGWRTFVSRMAALLFGVTTGLTVSDATTSFRCYNLRLVREVLHMVRAKRFAVQMELLGYCHLFGGIVAEVPAGYTLTGSTFTNSMILEALKSLVRLGAFRMFMGRSKDESTG